MHRDRVEEELLGAIALCLVLLLAPVSLVTRLLVAVLIAIALIVVLTLRSADWHEGGATPFDEVLLVGVALSIAHLVSILAQETTLMSQLLLLVAASFYATMAVLLARHRGWLFGETTR